MRNFVPTNRYIYLSPVSQQSKMQNVDSQKIKFYIAETNTTIESKYKVYQVQSVSSNISVGFKIGDYVVVNNTMIEKFSYENEEYYLILENYILGYFAKENL